MLSPMKLTVPSAAQKQLSQSANPNHWKTGRSESNLRLGGECWQINSILFPDGEMKVPLLSLQSMPVHKFSAIRIEGMVLENQCSNLPLFGSGQLSALVASEYMPFSSSVCFSANTPYSVHIHPLECRKST